MIPVVALTSELRRELGLDWEDADAVARHMAPQIDMIVAQGDRIIEELHLENDAQAWRLIYWQEWAAVMQQQRDSARSIAVSLENELAERQSGVREFTEAEAAEMAAWNALDKSDPEAMAVAGYEPMGEFDNGSIMFRGCWTKRGDQ